MYQPFSPELQILYSVVPSHGLELGLREPYYFYTRVLTYADAPIYIYIYIYRERERERERARERKRAGSMVIQVEAVLVETMRSTKIMMMMHTKFSGFST